MAAEVEDVLAFDPAFMPAAEKEAALLAWARVASLVEAERLRLLAVSGDVADAHGARDAGSWLAHATRSVAVEDRRSARLRRRMPSGYYANQPAATGGGIRPDAPWGGSGFRMARAGTRFPRMETAKGTRTWMRHQVGRLLERVKSSPRVQRSRVYRRLSGLGALTDISGIGDHVRASLLAEPGQDHRGVETAGIGEDDLQSHSSSSGAGPGSGMPRAMAQSLTMAYASPTP